MTRRGCFMIGHLKNFLLPDSGSIAVVFAISLPFLLSMAGLSVDVGDWYMQKRHLQTAADAASMAAALDLANQQNQYHATAAAQSSAEENSFDRRVPGNRLDVSYDMQGGRRTVQVSVHAQVHTWFVQVLDSRPVYADATATAQVDGTSGPYCLLALSARAPDAISASAGAAVDAPGCGAADNSANDVALHVGGSSSLHLGPVKIVGGFKAPEDQPKAFEYASIRTAASVTADPYVNLRIAPFNGCSASQQRGGPLRIAMSSAVTLWPGVYCGGIELKGDNAVTLLPGTYVMDGGDFSASGSGSITGKDVTIVLTNSGGSGYGNYGALRISGRRTVLLSAPGTGDYAGLAVVQDRKAPPRNDNTLTGSSGLTVDGAIYTPANALRFGGNGAVPSFTGTPCTRIIADVISFQGRPQLGNSCSSAASIGTPGVSLIL